MTNIEGCCVHGVELDAICRDCDTQVGVTRCPTCSQPLDSRDFAANGPVHATLSDGTVLRDQTARELGIAGDDT